MTDICFAPLYQTKFRCDKKNKQTNITETKQKATCWKKKDICDVCVWWGVEGGWGGGGRRGHHHCPESGEVEDVS